METLLSSKSLERELEKLAVNVFPKKEGSVKETPKSGVKAKRNLKIETCKFCKGKTKNLKLHLRSCILNPDFQEVMNGVICPKCEMEVELRSYQSHVDSCPGGEAGRQRLIQNRRERQDLKRRKAQARANGELFVSKSGKVSVPSAGVRKETLLPSDTVETDIEKSIPSASEFRKERKAKKPNKISDKTGLDKIKSAMRDRLINSDVTLRELAAWEEITEEIWSKA